MGNQYNSNSVAPGWPVLLATTAYTAICITIGFLFICRKKKWGNKDKHSKSRSGDDGEFGSPSTNASQAWIDPTPYLCAVHEVVGNKAYEYFFRTRWK
jgi:hypothetical protein